MKSFESKIKMLILFLCFFVIIFFSGTMSCLEGIPSDGVTNSSSDVSSSSSSSISTTSSSASSTSSSSSSSSINIIMITVPSTGGVTMQGRTVSLSTFLIAQTETTYSNWYFVKEWATANGYTFANIGTQGGITAMTGVYPSDQEPVTMINWRDAVIWCNALSQMQGFTPVYYTDAAFTSILKTVDASKTLNTTQGAEDNPYVNWSANGYRLPTEAEWEYAASYVTNTTLINPSYMAGATGDYLNKAACDEVAVYGMYYDSSGPLGYASTGVTNTAEVGTKKPNALILYDMSGNVNEWCWDWYIPVVVKVTENNPQGPETMTTGYPWRIMRGGGFDSLTYGCRPSAHNSNNPSNRDNLTGFRVARNSQ